MVLREDSVLHSDVRRRLDSVLTICNSEVKRSQEPKLKTEEEYGNEQSRKMSNSLSTKLTARF